jgi:WD40 repeat protein
MGHSAHHSTFILANLLARLVKGFGLYLVAVPVLAGCNSGSPPTSALVMSARPHALSVDTIAWSPDGRHIASGSLDTAINLWDVSGGSDNHLTKAGGSIAAVAWSPDSAFLAIAAHEPNHVLWLWRTADLTKSYLPDPAQDEQISSLSWSPDGSSLAAGIMKVSAAGISLGGSIYINQLDTGITHTLTSTEPILSVSWSPNGAYLAGRYSTTHRGDDLGHIRVWDMRTKSLVVELDPQSNVTAISWSPDSRLLALGRYDGMLEIWDWAANKRLQTLQGQSGIGPMIKSVSWSPDGKYIASGSWDKSALVRDAQTYNLKYSFQTPDYVNCLSWSPDSKLLATGLDDGEVLVWSVK